MSIYLQNFMPIQPRTSLLKFGHLAAKSGKGTVLYLSTKLVAAVLPAAAVGGEADELRGVEEDPSAHRDHHRERAPWR